MDSHEEILKTCSEHVYKKRKDDKDGNAKTSLLIDLKMLHNLDTSKGA